MVMVAIALPVLLGATALAVDLGFHRVDRREMQKVADVVSLDLARQISTLGANRGQILAADLDADGVSDWQQAIVDSAARNGHDLSFPAPICATSGTLTANCLTATMGVWDVNTSTFTSCNNVPAWAADPAQCVPTAVQVMAGSPIDYLIRPGGSSTRRIAVAAIADTELASFRLGSSLAAINPQSSTIIGQLLNSVTNGDATVLAYNGLVNADVGLDALGVALGIPITAMSPQELANTTVSFEQLVVASAQALQSGGGNTAAITLLNDLAALDIHDAQLNLADVLGVDASNDTIPAATGFVDVTSLLVTSVFLVDNDHFITIPNMAATIPGVTAVQLHLTGIEAPVTVTGGDGASGTTRQVNVEIVPTFDLNSSQISQRLCDLPLSERNIVTALLSGLLNLLGCLLAPLQTFPLGVNVTGQPTIALSLAQVTGTQTIDCANDQFTVHTTPSVVDLAADFELAIAAFLGTPSDPRFTTQLARMRVPAGASTSGGGGSATFTGINPIALPTGVQYFDFTPPAAQIGSNPIGLANLLNVGPATVTALGSINLSTLANIIVARAQPVLNAVLGQLDTHIIQPLVQMLGLHVGGSHVTPMWLRCDRSAVTLVR